MCSYAAVAYVCELLHGHRAQRLPHLPLQGPAHCVSILREGFGKYTQLDHACAHLCTGRPAQVALLPLAARSVKGA